MKIIKFLFIFLLGIISFRGYSQTNPTAQSLPFNFTSLSGTTLPAGMAAHRFGTSAAAIPTTRTTSNGNADLPNGSGTSGGWAAEATNGVSLLASSSQSAGAIVVSIVTTGYTNIQVSWKAGTILQQISRDNSIALQYRVGTSGSWFDVGTTTTYTSQGKIAGDISSTLSETLPVGAEGQSVVQVRWIYWESNSVSGSRDRINIDDISISGTAGSCPSITTQPSNSSMVWGNNTSINISATNTTGYQWEINTGSVWSSITDNSTYSGSTTSTLTITNASLSMNGYKYRCILSASSCSNVTSDSSILTVNNRTNVSYSGLVINEASQGESGAREYIEMLAVGTPCATIDVRGWIIDDNNGVFSGNAMSGAGIASGYIRFSENPLWSNVPVGTLILIYNGSDISSSILTYTDTDPTDYRLIFGINLDSTYFVAGDSLSPSSVSMTYTNNRNVPKWTYIGLANNSTTSNDGIQLRNRNATFVHGVSYTDNGSGSIPQINLYNHPDSSIYNNHSLFFTTVSSVGGVSNRNYYIKDTLFNYDFRDTSNWKTDTGYVSRTPGAANNAKNSAWISYLMGSCPLPIEINEFKSNCDNDITKIHFSTLSQSNVDYFILQKSEDGRNWSDVKRIKGEIFSNQLKEYNFTDEAGYFYYRIKEVDLDGKIIYSRIILSNCSGGKSTLIRQIDNTIIISSNENITTDVYAIDGKLIRQSNSSELNLDDISKGIYIIKCYSDDMRINITKKIIIH